MPNTLTTKCCVPNCGITRLDGTILHTFPNPEKDPDRFRTWLYAIVGDLLSMENKAIFKCRRVCHEHFETRFHTTSNRLCPNAVPTLNLPGLHVTSGKPLQEISNINVELCQSEKAEEMNLCKPSSSNEKVLHRFPDLNKDPQRFNAWLSAIGGELLTIDHQLINKNYKVCCDHFERRYYNRFNRLCINAVPTLNLKGSLERASTPLLNKNYAGTDMVISTSGSKRSAPLLRVNNQNVDVKTTPTAGVKQPLHRFPNPAKERERFNHWLYAVDGDTIGLENEHIFKYRRVCRRHFENKYLCRSNKISNIAVPTLHMPGPPKIATYVLKINNQKETGSVVLTSAVTPKIVTTTPKINNQKETDSVVAASAVNNNGEINATNSNTLEMPKVVIGKILPYGNVEIMQQEKLTKPKLVSKNLQTDKFCPYGKAFKVAVYKDQSCYVDLPPLCNTGDESTGVNLMRRGKNECCKKVVALTKKVKILKKVNERYKMKLKEIKKDIRNHPLFKRAEQKMTKQALGFILMQLRVYGSKVHGRRFTQEDKDFALALLQMGRNFYKWFSCIFTLPSLTTLRHSLQNEQKTFQVDQISAETAAAVETLSQPLYTLQPKKKSLQNEQTFQVDQLSAETATAVETMSQPLYILQPKIKSLQHEQKTFQVEQMSAETAAAKETMSQPLYTLQPKKKSLQNEQTFQVDQLSAETATAVETMSQPLYILQPKIKSLQHEQKTFQVEQMSAETAAAKETMSQPLYTLQPKRKSLQHEQTFQVDQLSAETAAAMETMSQPLYILQPKRKSLQHEQKALQVEKMSAETAAAVETLSQHLYTSQPKRISLQREQKAFQVEQMSAETAAAKETMSQPLYTLQPKRTAAAVETLSQPLYTLQTKRKSLQHEQKAFQVDQMSAETAAAVETLSQPLYILQPENAYFVSEYELHHSDDIVI